MTENGTLARQLIKAYGIRINILVTGQVCIINAVRYTEIILFTYLLLGKKIFIYKFDINNRIWYCLIGTGKYVFTQYDTCFQGFNNVWSFNFTIICTNTHFNKSTKLILP